MEKDLICYYQERNLNCRILNCDEKNSIGKIIEQLYVRENAKYGFSLFDMLKCEEMVGVNLFESWSWINEFIQHKIIIVFFDYKVGEYVELTDGGNFTNFYDDCPKVEFYMTDRTGSFLLGYNHSHCLFGMGTAADWLEENDNYKKYYNPQLSQQSSSNKV